MSAFRSTLVPVVACLLGALAVWSCGGSSEPSATGAPAAAAIEEVADAPLPVEGAAGTPAAPETDAPDQPSVPDYAPERATGAVKGSPAPTNTAPIVAIANYFAELPGIDLSGLDARQKEKFLHRVNSELCTCGCKNDTLARCLVNDPACPVVKGMVLTVLDEVKSAR